MLEFRSLVLFAVLSTSTADSWVYEVHNSLTGDIAAIQAFTSVPAASALATRGGVCGGRVHAGDVIPVFTNWSVHGSTSATDASCVLVSGAAALYGKLPGGSSSGLEQAATATLLIAVDSSGAAHLLWLHDRSGNAAGGTASAIIDAPDLAGSGARLELVDGGTAAGNVFDATAGHGQLSWAWTQCCTGGAVLGPLPPSAPACIGFRYTAVTGTRAAVDLCLSLRSVTTLCLWVARLCMRRRCVCCSLSCACGI